ncbi:MAG: L-ectoine synthase [Halothiobacillus sp. 24-54-40]|jgi:L-ectoine synthase|nr:MAG: L-ectoine synthase [Halothiobacillus sp. 35-54-62]OYY54305.1 MAG: L-ectoine synthase [Halothiobacillus sp. 28-55-5]OYZ87915.1 MAG: L-ectoine synthase [Halothiobacillus sp. 24-54-40]OZA80352.1 MAG: L-ectoine synthase [Halothiobacillus sp. 39-53-45]HQS02116.1 ectoine synthase [Halothiobacillus sp.]
MIVRRIQDIKNTKQSVSAPGGQWVSNRLLLAGDGLGYSLHETTIFAGTQTYIHYANHVESVYCVGGVGEIEDLESGLTHPITNGTLYVLNGHERHWLRATTADLRLICVFNPPIVGTEVHDEHGVYPLLKAELNSA